MVLCITHSGDFYTIDIVQRSLQQAGIKTFRLNTDEFATHCKLNYRLLNGVQDISITTRAQTINASQITGVWYRKLWKLQVPQDLDATYHEIFTKEYQAYLQLFFHQLRQLPWMNDMQTDHFVGNDKFIQLSCARKAGLITPESIFTNDPEAIRNLFDRFNGNLIVKLQGALSKSMEGNTAFFPTTKLTSAHLERLDELAYCPMIFQEYIEKLYELRVVYVDGEFFTGMIPNEYAGVTDWRTIKNARIAWQAYQLPADMQEKIHGMMQAHGLLFGAIDIIRNTKGDYIFLEVNPQGEWGMLQKYLNYPIGKTIAQKLITRIKNGKE